MFDKKQFDSLIKEFDEQDSQRELLIKKARDVLKLSKQLIYSIHRGDLPGAKQHTASIQKEFLALDMIAKKTPELSSEGSFKVASQEYTEALCYYSYVTENSIPTYTQLGVPPFMYILGLCDLTGELVRKAINDAIKGDLHSALRIKESVEELYGELLRFDFRDSELRRKFDSVKYDLKRLEDIALSIKLKAK
jgi:translin